MVDNVQVRRAMWKLGLVAVLAVAGVLPSTARAQQVGGFAEARQQPLGSTVTVVGIVTVPSGAFVPNDTGFALQDHQTGLYVHSSGGQTLELGQVVRVTGTLRNNFGGVLGIRPTRIEVLGDAPVPPAHPVKTGDVNEESEGRLVRVKGTIVSAIFDDAPYGWKFDVDDGSGVVTVFVYTGTGIDVSGLQPGQRVVIDGFSGQFVDHFEVTPRVQEDIRILPAH